MRPVALALLLALALASCGGGDDPTPPKQPQPKPLRVGTKNFTESVILGQLYKQALEAKGIRVDLQSSVGSTEVTNKALRDGFLDMYPEYIGVLLSEVDGIVARPASSQAAYRLAKREEERRGFTLLRQTRLSNDNALAVKRSFSRRRHVSSIPDLKRLRPAPRLGAAPEFRNRFEGLVGLRKRYGLKTLRMTPLDVGKGEQYPALDKGEIDVALVFTTDSKLAGGRYRLLEDPKDVFAINHVAPRISKKALTRYGRRLATTLDAVSALLTTPVMRRLNARADVDKRSPEQVADEFLRAHGLK